MHRSESARQTGLALHDARETRKVRARRTGWKRKNTIPFLKTAHAAPRNQVTPMQPKTAKRRSAFRRANRTMPRRRIDIAIEAIDYKNPDLLKKFVTESGKILPAPRHRHAGAPASQDHPRDQAQPFGAVDEVRAKASRRLSANLATGNCASSVFSLDAAGPSSPSPAGE